MKGFLAALQIFTAVCPAIASDAGDAFCRDIQSALQAKDTARLAALTDATGLTLEARARQPEAFSALIARGPVYAVSLGPLPPDFPPFLVAQGKRLEPSHPPAGAVTITFRQPNGLTSEQLPYAIINGTYRLVATRTTDLAWTGPPDVPLTLVVTGAGAENAVSHVRYNASGIDVPLIIRGPSATLMGQFFIEVNVTTADPSPDIGLTLARDGSEIFKVVPGAGASRVDFKK